MYFLQHFLLVGLQFFLSRCLYQNHKPLPNTFKFKYCHKGQNGIIALCSFYISNSQVLLNLQYCNNFFITLNTFLTWSFAYLKELDPVVNKQETTEKITITPKQTFCLRESQVQISNLQTWKCLANSLAFKTTVSKPQRWK